MENRNRGNDFRDRWGIHPSSAEDSVNEFKERLHNATAIFLDSVAEIPFFYLRRHLTQLFSTAMGSRYDSDIILNSLFLSKDYLSTIRWLQNLFWAIENLDITRAPSSYLILQTHLDIAAPAWNFCVQYFIKNLNMAIRASGGINVRQIQSSDGKVDLYPSGVRLLDDTIYHNVAWLEQYPDIAKEFRNALTIAAAKDRQHYRNALDSLRVCVEQLLKVTLVNNVSLERQIENKNLEKWLKEKGVHAQIRRDYTTLLDHFALYQNAEAKHPATTDPDAAKVYSENELEYMIYQTSIFMRLIMKVGENP